jgi:hypothetical protein
MTKKELKLELQSILALLGTASRDSVASSYEYSPTDVNARKAYEVGYLGGRIEQATNDLLTIVDGMK